MRQLIRRNIVIAVGAGLLGLYAVVGALAAPDVTPWPDPFQSSPDDVTVQEEPSDPSAPSNPSEPSEPTEPSGPSEPSDPEDGDGDSVGTEQVEDGEEHG
ncbi:MAG: hypothetical protein HY723_06630, partial [Chloroflexi bacterium]|nr:hypothetical protein [Chloroflexota bacterium]